ncbi:MAG: hypothetical protein WAS21_09990 [Geminicoccaceae bacterium]
MRSPSFRAIVLAPVIAIALFGSTTDLGRASQVGGTLAVTVRVVASCSAALVSDSSATVGTACPSTSAPLAIMTETVAPDAVPVEAYTIEDGVADVDVRYLTLIY